MKKILVFIFLISNQLYFGQCEDPIAKMLEGVWVKDTSPKDTIKFGMKNQYQNFELILADQKNQYGPAGPYEYRALDGAMLIHWTFAGSFIPQTISFFRGRDGGITIGNFYRTKTDEKTFKFHKIK